MLVRIQIRPNWSNEVSCHELLQSTQYQFSIDMMGVGRSSRADIGCRYASLDVSASTLCPTTERSWSVVVARWHELLL
jgi:hypothetical protein